MIMDSQRQDAEMMLRHYIHDYLLKRNFHATAQAFKNEVNIPDEPMEILDDSHSNFLLDWWSIFSDLYFQKQSSGEGQGTIQKELLLEPIKRSNKQDPWLQMHRNMTPQGTSTNCILHCFPLMRNQENERQCALIRQFASIDETGARQPKNFFGDMQQDKRSRSTPAYDHLGQVQHLNFHGSLLMGSKHARLIKSPPMELCGQDKLIGWPHSGFDPTFSSVRQKGINPPLVCSNQVPQLHSFTWHQEQSPAQGLHVSVMDNSNNMDPLILGLLDNNFNKNINQIGSSSVQKVMVMTMAEEENELVDEQVKENNGNSVESQSFPEDGAGDDNTKAQP